MVDNETMEMLRGMDLLYEYNRGKVIISDHAASDKYKRWIDVSCYRMVGYVLCPYCNDKTYWRWPEARWNVNSRKRCPKCKKRVYTSEDWFSENVQPKESREETDDKD